MYTYVMRYCCVAMPQHPADYTFGLATTDENKYSTHF